MSQLARKRKAMGLTQHELSQGARIPRWKITFAETGRLRFTPEETERILKVFARRAAEISAMVSTPA